MTLLTLLLRFLVLGECVETGCFEQMQLLVVIIALHQLVVDVHRAPLTLCHDRRREGLLVVAIVEGTVGDSHVGLRFVAM